ncbi:hypothetical protein FOCG_08786 [Fusarium oxysporum f. sp. radicis-lycopersici 26381]|nr:hypothetical protein FOCG_08786 [Fusarium oxysporum f. sp. radicis-lycopersici 26381]
MGGDKCDKYPERIAIPLGQFYVTFPCIFLLASIHLQLGACISACCSFCIPGGYALQRGVALGPRLHRRAGSTQLRTISMLHLVKTKKTSQRHIRAWETWGKFRIPEQEHLWRSYTTRVTVSEMTDVINSHWPLIICVLTNPSFVETISN